MAITFFGVASTPADGAATTNTTDPTVVTPPSNMLSGDLAIMCALCRTSSATLAVSATGGQTWTPINPSLNHGGTGTSRQFWCVFNGTWSASPSVSFGAATNNTVVMVVFRPTSSLSAWNVQGLANGNQSFVAPSSPFTITVANSNYTPANNNNLNIAIWMTDDDNTWGTLSGTNWDKTGLSAQYRNTSGSDSSMSIAYQIQTLAAATNSVSQNQATNGGDPATTQRFGFYELLEPRLYKITQLNQAVNRSNTY